MIDLFFVVFLSCRLDVHFEVVAANASFPLRGCAYIDVLSTKWAHDLLHACVLVDLSGYWHTALSVILNRFNLFESATALHSTGI